MVHYLIFLRRVILIKIGSPNGGISLCKFLKSGWFHMTKKFRIFSIISLHFDVKVSHSSNTGGGGGDWKKFVPLKGGVGN
jgi:hypothetical protein